MTEIEKFKCAVIDTVSVLIAAHFDLQNCVFN